MPPKILGKMVYSYRQPMWHGITEPSVDPMGAEQVMNERFDGGFTTQLAQSAYLTESGETVPTDGKFTILRSPTKADPNYVVFGTCTDRYHPLQPMDVAKRFDECVSKPVETMAFLGQGEDMFISWELPSFDVLPNDEIQLYSIIRGGFDTEHGWNLFTSAYRPVCYNTITLAQNWANNNSGGNKLVGNQWKGKGINKNLLEHMGYWMEFLQNTATEEAGRVEAFFKTLANTPITGDAEVYDILENAYPFKAFNAEKIPPQLRAKAEKDSVEYNEGQQRIRDGIFQMWSGKGTQITPDFWGVLNSTTEFVCHYMPSKKPIAESVMFGNRAGIVGRLVNVLQNRIA